ncbi:MAG: T9SS type A sorting domain-containing protein, partial [Bacteroidales bacterium]|nr:T9SS type A sorting domain-containing protein [Bacteroidales bacterium]
VVSDKAVCAIYDLTGRKMVDRRLSGAEYNSFEVPAALKGIHLVKVTDGIKVYSQKVIF